MTSLGELSALGAASLWAISTIIYRSLGAALPPLVLNLVKGTIATLLLTATLLLWPSAALTISSWGLLVLVLSGAIGIGVGDTAFFGALNRLGERRTLLIVETAAPLFTVTLGSVWLAEKLSPLAILGVVITLTGVVWVILERASAATILEPAVFRRGVASAVFSAGCTSVGAVMTRSVFLHEEVNFAFTALIRILGGVAVLLVWMPLTREAYVPVALRRWKPWPAILAATFMGTFLGLSLLQAALQHTSAGVVQTLIATSCLFVLPLVMMRGEQVTARAMAGAAVAVVGVAMLFIAAG